MNGQHHLAITLCLLAACQRDEPAPSAPSSPTAEAPSRVNPDREPPVAPPAPAPPMPRPARRRLAAAAAQNDACESCHVDEAEEWRASRHRQSDTNAAYREAFAIERTTFCRACHTPEADPEKAPPRVVSEMGVACVTCHVTEEGAVLAAPGADSSLIADAPHRVVRSADFAHTGGCSGCHEFRFPGISGDEDAAFMQTTVREHRRSAAARRGCADCHMPLVGERRSHAFGETRDPAWMRDKLAVTAERAGGDLLRVTLAQPDPGHGYPTGDLFRRLEIGCELFAEDGRSLAREVRHLARRFEIAPGKWGRDLTRDDRVLGEPLVLEIPIRASSPVASATLRFWVSYQRVATVGVGRDPAEARIESEILLHSGDLPWNMD